MRLLEQQQMHDVRKKGSITKMGGHGFLNELLSGSLVGNAITA